MKYWYDFTLRYKKLSLLFYAARKMDMEGTCNEREREKV